MQVKKVFTLLLIATSNLLISTSSSCKLFNDDYKKEPRRKYETALWDIITKTDLGSFEGKPSEEQIKNRLKVLYHDLDTNGLKTRIFTEEEVWIYTGTSGYYPGHVKLTYTDLEKQTGSSDISSGKTYTPLEKQTGSSDTSLGKKYEIALSDIITKTDLGTIEPSDHSWKPSEEDFKNRLEKEYPNLTTKGLAMVHGDRPKTINMPKTIHIFSSNSGYKPGEIILTYRTPTKRLKDIITNPDLGEINPCGRSLSEEIKNRLHESYGIEREAIDVYTADGLAMIMPNTDYGDYYLADPLEVTLTYTISEYLQYSYKPDFTLEATYKILGIDKNTSYETAKETATKLMRKYHTDKQKQDLTDTQKDYYNKEFGKVKKALDSYRYYIDLKAQQQRGNNKKRNKQHEKYPKKPKESDKPNVLALN